MSRNRRKKTFRLNDEERLKSIKLVESSPPRPSSTKILIKQEKTSPPESPLNIRRSSRKPKPKKHDDDMTVEQPTVMAVSEEDFLIMQNLQYDGSEDLGRRETRKTYQNYLETLGYNTDYSKISTELSAKHPVNVNPIKSSEKSKTGANVKLEFSHAEKTENKSQSVEKNISTKVRASSRAPRPKRTFSLIEDDVPSILYNSDLLNDQQDKEESKKIAKRKRKSSKPHKHIVTEQNVSTTTPLSKQDVEELSGEEENSQTRISTRVRVPKRKFSLIEDFPLGETKRQRIMSPEQTKEIKQEIVENIVTPEQSKLVVKRTDSRRKRHEVDVEKKGEEDREKNARKNLREKEKKISIRNKKQKLEESNIPKETIKEKLSKGEETKKSTKTRKVLKKNNIDKSGSVEDKNNKEHIVLKLTIPHDSPEEKHHKHHKHKKDKRELIDGNKKKRKTENEEKNGKVKEIGSEDSGGKFDISDVKTKKKKKKKSSLKDDLSSDTVPHVKLVIKKSPVKAKGVKVTIKPSIIEDHTDETWLPTTTTKKSRLKAVIAPKPSTKKQQSSLNSSNKRTLKKDVKVKAVSAYSLFTRSRRKGLEPGLDFASASRRFAEMWKELSNDDKEYWRKKAALMRKPLQKGNKRKEWLRGSPADIELVHSSGIDALDMAAYLKLLGESLSSIGMCLKRQDQMEVHGSLSVLLDTALCSIVPLFCLTSQLPEMSGCSPELQAEILDNLAYIIPGL